MNQEKNKEEIEFKNLDKDFKIEINLLKEFQKLYLDKEKKVKKILNALRRYSRGQVDKYEISLLQENRILLNLLDKMITYGKFEDRVVNEILGEEENKSTKVREIKEILEVEYNLKHIKELLIDLRSYIVREIQYLGHHRITTLSVEILKKQKHSSLVRVLKDELALFRNIKLYYITTFRKIRDYLRNLLEKKPLISVIIPAFNEEELIMRCLHSVARQSYPNKEIIVVDNKSTDNTNRVIAPYTYYVSYLGIKGVSMAKNVGAKLAHGEILVFLDADSIAYKDLLEGIRLAFLEGYNCGKVIDIRADIGGTKPKLMGFWWFLQNKVHQITHLPISGAGMCMFCDRDLFFKIGGWNTALKANVDVDLTARLVKNGKFKFFSKGYIITSMRVFEKRGYLYKILEHMIRGLFPSSRDREWVR